MSKKQEFDNYIFHTKNKVKKRFHHYKYDLLNFVVKSSV